jgi:hypothetical protein
MTYVTGHILRMAGLLLEVLGIWSVYSGSVARTPQIPLAGGKSLPLPWLGVGLGFALWFVGTVMVYIGRRARALNAQREADRLNPFDRV